MTYSYDHGLVVRLGFGLCVNSFACIGATPTAASVVAAPAATVAAPTAATAVPAAAAAVSTAATVTAAAAAISAVLGVVYLIIGLFVIGDIDCKVVGIALNNTN